MKRKIFAILLFLTVIGVNAQNIIFSATAPRVVQVGERFRLTYSINEPGENLTIPGMQGFEILMGPNTSRSSSVEWINGKITTKKSFTHSYILLANKKGKFSIPSAKITVNGKEYSSNAINIEVIEGNSQQQGSTPSAPGGKNQQPAPQTGTDNSSDNFLVRVHLSKNNLYQGEHLIATLKIYTRYNQVSNFSFRFPVFEGFLSQEIPNSQQQSFQRDTYNGNVYNSVIINKFVLFPQRSGKLTIEPFEVECTAKVRTSGGGGIFDDFFGKYRNIHVNRKSPQMTVNVTNLPAGKPYNFSGAVGRFNLHSSIGSDSVKANDAITLNVKINGNGNLKLMKPLKFNFPPDFEVYDPEISKKIGNTSAGASGTVNYKYLIIPRYGGNFTIPSAGFSYFDPKSETYKQLSTKEFHINVERGESDQNGTVVNSYNKENVKYLGQDIHFIKTKTTALLPAGTFFFGSKFYLLALFIPLLLFILLIIIYGKKMKLNANAAALKNKRANKIARKRLKQAQQSLKAKDKQRFYNNVLEALWGYTSDKLNLPTSELSKDNIRELFAQKGVDDNLSTEFIVTLNHCEYAQYAPVNEAGQMEKIYKDALKIISKLEDTI